MNLSQRYGFYSQDYCRRNNIPIDLREEQDMVGKIVSHFRIIEKLGEGGMGIVYKAHDNTLDRTVALKFVTADSTLKEEESKKRFLQEARAAAKLSHQNICSIYSIDEYEGQPFIEMEYIEGRTLRKKMQESGKVDVDTFKKYALQLSEALAAAHEKGIVHRDIKPENIMVDINGKVKIMDFGLAKLRGMHNYTQARGTVGTLKYMSPEQIQGAEIDGRSDLFSLGIIFYELLTGVHPFDAEYQQALLFKILNEEPKFSSLFDGIPEEIKQVVDRCLQKDPEHRYHSADELTLDLKKENGFPVQAIPTSAKNWWPLLSNLHNQKYVISIASVGFLVLLLGSLWIYPISIEDNPELSIPDQKHIAVLPFNNLSPDRIPEYFNDGIIEVLTSQITQMEMFQGSSVWVIPSSEVRAGDISSVKEAAQMFGANLAVTGSMQYVGNRLLLTINLIDGETMRQLRSTILEMEWSDQIRLHEEIVQNLTNMLEIELEPRAMESITAIGTVNSTVYQFYIEGKGFLSRNEDAESIDKALEIFTRIIETDPRFVRGYAGLAEAYWRKYELTRDTQWAERATRYGQEAINLMDAQIPEVYITMALINNGLERHEEALELLQSLNEQERNSYQAIIQQAQAYEGLGQKEEAEELFLKAINRKKHFWDGYQSLGVFYYRQGRYEEAAQAFEKVTELAPLNVGGFLNLGGAYLRLGNVDEGLEAFHRSLEIRPSYRAFTNLGINYYYQRDYSKAARMCEQALELNDTDRRIWGALGYAYYWSGKDSATVTSTMNKAIELTEQELEVTPNNQTLLREQAGYYLTVGDTAQSRKLLRKLIGMNEQETNTRLAIISLFERLGERDSALRWMEESLKLGDNIEILGLLQEMDDLLEDSRANELREKYSKINVGT